MDKHLRCFTNYYSEWNNGKTIKAVLFKEIAMGHMWLIDLNLNYIKLIIQFLSCTNYIPCAQ